MVTRKPSTAPASAIQRTRASSLTASASTPAAIGIQMASESSGQLAMPEPPDDPAHADQDAEQHEEGIGIDQAGLDQADHAREPAHDARRAVHCQPVDHGLVAAAPETLAEAARAAGEEPGIQLVEAVLALDQRVQRAEGLGDALRKLGIFSIEV